MNAINMGDDFAEDRTYRWSRCPSFRTHMGIVIPQVLIMTFDYILLFFLCKIDVMFNIPVLLQLYIIFSSLYLDFELYNLQSLHLDDAKFCRCWIYFFHKIISWAQFLVQACIYFHNITIFVKSLDIIVKSYFWYLY